LKSALITGITGQDGTLLTELLLQRNYRVVGICRTLPASEVWRKYLDAGVELILGDVTSKDTVEGIVNGVNFNEIYHLASFNSVRESFEHPELAEKVNLETVKRIVKEIKSIKSSTTRIFNASSSEVFSITSTELLNEDSPKKPSSPYGVTKLLAQHQIKSAREVNGIFAVNGILFNHESEYRQSRFFSKKAVKGLVDVYLGKCSNFQLESLDSFRDWGYAKDYVNGIWQSLQNENPNDYIFATGELHTARDFIQIGMEYLSMEKDIEEIIEISADSKIVSDPRRMVGNSERAVRELKWERSLNFKSLIYYLIDQEIKSRNIT
jgi:GDPmannose 4,6-dehydratase